MTGPEVAASVQELGTLIREYRAQNDARLLALEQKSGTGGSEERLARLDTRLDELQDSITRAQRMPWGGLPQPAALSQEAREHKTAFLRYLRTGREDGLRDLETRAMSVGSDPDGGYMVPSDMSGRVVEHLYETSPIRQVALVVPTSATEYIGWSDLTEAGGGWTDETSTPTETTTPTLGQYRIPTHHLFAEPRASQTMLDDAGSDFENWLTRKIASKLARLEATAFVSGSGVGRARGFTTYTTVATADASRAWGQLEHVTSGANGAFAASNPGDKLLDLIYKLNPAYRTGARWVMARSLVAEVRKLKDGQGLYIWAPGLGAMQPQTLLGYPITEAEDMPTLATGSLSLAFGDFREGYTIVDRIGLRITADPYTAKPFVKFYATRRVGGAVVNSDAIKFLKFSA